MKSGGVEDEDNAIDCDDGFGDFQQADGDEAYAQIGSEESDDYDEEGYGEIDHEPMATFDQIEGQENKQRRSNIKVAAAIQSPDEDEPGDQIETTKVLTQVKQEKIRSAMAKLSLQKPIWAEKVEENVWLANMFQQKQFD